MEKWMVAAKRADFKGIGERFGIDQVTARNIFTEAGKIFTVPGC